MPYGSGSQFDTTIKVWNTTTWRLVYTYTGHMYPIFYAEFLNDTTIASCSIDQTIQIWRIGGQNAYIRNITIVPNFVFGPNGPSSSIQSTPTTLKLLPNNLLASGDLSGVIYIWNLTSSSLFPLVEKVINAHTSIILQFELVSDELMASAADDSTIKIWNITTSPITLVNTLDVGQPFGVFTS